MDQDMRWFELPLYLQIGNIGSEAHRAIRFKNSSDHQKSANFCNKAIEFWERTKRDPKNQSRLDEIDNAILEETPYGVSLNLRRRSGVQLGSLLGSQGDGPF